MVGRHCGLRCVECSPHGQKHACMRRETRKTGSVMVREEHQEQGSSRRRAAHAGSTMRQRMQAPQRGKDRERVKPYLAQQAAAAAEQQNANQHNWLILCTLEELQDFSLSC